MKTIGGIICPNPTDLRLKYQIMYLYRSTLGHQPYPKSGLSPYLEDNSDLCRHQPFYFRLIRQVLEEDIAALG